MRALQRIGKAAVPAVSAALSDDEIRLEAAEILRSIDPTAKPQANVAQVSAADLKALRISLTNVAKDVEARITAAGLLGQLGVLGAEELIAAFGDEQKEVRRAAAAAFAQIGVAGVPVLQQAIKHESAVVRASAADGLAAIGPDARAAVPQLIEALQDKDRTVRHRAVMALDAFRESAVDAIPALIAVLHNPRDMEATRQMAVKALLRTGPSARATIVTALKKASSDENYGVRSLAEDMLKKIEQN